MEGEGEQVQGDEDAGKVFFAMAEIVLDVVALGLDDIEGFIYGALNLMYCDSLGDLRHFPSEYWRYRPRQGGLRCDTKRNPTDPVT